MWMQVACRIRSECIYASRSKSERVESPNLIKWKFFCAVFAPLFPFSSKFFRMEWADWSCLLLLPHLGGRETTDGDGGVNGRREANEIWQKWVERVEFFVFRYEKDFCEMCSFSFSSLKILFSIQLRLLCVRRFRLDHCVCNSNFFSSQQFFSTNVHPLCFMHRRKKGLFLQKFHYVFSI